MARAKSPASAQSTATIGKILDYSRVAIERDNPRLKGVLLKENDYIHKCVFDVDCIHRTYLN